MKHLLISILAFVLWACTTTATPNTKAVKFDLNVIQTIPEEIAIDTVISFSKTTAKDPDSNCVYTDVGVGHKNDSAIVPYRNLYFNAENTTDNPIEEDNPHVFLFKKSDGKLLCDSRLGTGGYAGAQKEFDDRFKWFGSALIALKAEYRE